MTTTARRQLAVALTVAGLALGVVGGGCGASPGQATDGGIFVPFGADFAGFRGWPSQAVDSALAAGATHVSGPRTVFINQLPPPGATAFPVGTMIVKVTEADGKIFARAKRGGGYNRSGAIDWEWLELTEGTAGVAIKWGGFGPPLGEMYGGDPNGGCNGCHVAAGKGNDYVLSSWLQLGPGTDGGAPQDSGVPDGSVADGGTPPDDGAALDGGAPPADGAVTDGAGLPADSGASEGAAGG